VHAAAATTRTISANANQATVAVNEHDIKCCKRRTSTRQTFHYCKP
jgi:hypothetical protein